MPTNDTSEILKIIESYLHDPKIQTPDWLIINDRRNNSNEPYHLDEDKTQEAACGKRADSYTDAALLLWKYLNTAAQPNIRAGIESLKTGAKPTSPEQLNAHIALLADLLVSAANDKVLTKQILFRYLLDAEQLVCWRKGDKAIVTISNCANPVSPTEQYTLVQLDSPRTFWTTDQQREFRLCSGKNPADWPVWFRALDGWEQTYWHKFLADHPGDLNEVLSSPPCTRRRYPGLANYFWHTFVVYRAGNYQPDQRLIELTRARSSIIYPISIKDQNEARRIAKNNVEQLRADHGFSNTNKERSLLLLTLVTPAVFAGQPFYEGLMRQEKCKIANEFAAAIETNYPLNQTWFHPADRYGTGKFSPEEDYRKAIVKLVASVKRHLEEKTPLAAKILIDHLSELEDGFAKKPQFLRVPEQKTSIEKLLPTKIAKKLTKLGNSREYQAWFSLVSCLREYLRLHRLQATKQDKWHGFLLPALEEIIIASLDDAIAHASCKSGKDRRAMLLLLEDSLLCLGAMTEESFKQNNESDKHWLATIFITLFTSGHHQYIAARNASGCYGLKSIEDVLPSFILIGLKSIRGLLSHNKTCSEMNHPELADYRHYKEQYLSIIKQYAEEEITEVGAWRALKQLRQRLASLINSNAEEEAPLLAIAESSAESAKFEDTLAAEINDIGILLQEGEAQGVVIIPINPTSAKKTNNNNDDDDNEVNELELKHKKLRDMAMAEHVKRSENAPDDTNDATATVSSSSEASSLVKVGLFSPKASKHSREKQSSLSMSAVSSTSATSSTNELETVIQVRTASDKLRSAWPGENSKSGPCASITIVFEGLRGIVCADNNFFVANFYATMLTLRESPGVSKELLNPIEVGASHNVLSFYNKKDQRFKFSTWINWDEEWGAKGLLSICNKNIGALDVVVIFICKRSVEQFKHRYEMVQSKKEPKHILLLEVISDNASLGEAEKKALLKKYPCSGYLQFSLSNLSSEELMKIFEVAVELIDSRLISEPAVDNSSSLQEKKVSNSFLRNFGKELFGRFSSFSTSSLYLDQRDILEEIPGYYLHLLVCDFSDYSLQLFSSFLRDTPAKIDINCGMKSVNIEDKKVNLIVRSAAHTIKYKEVQAPYYRDAHGFLLVVDVTSRQDFEELKRCYLEDITKENKKSNFILVTIELVRSPQKTEIKQEAKTFAKKNNMEYLDISYNDLFNFSAPDVFLLLAKQIYERISRQEQQMVQEGPG
jgi:Ras-related protein Rab-2A